MKPGFPLFLLLALVAHGWALQIDLDFSYDQANGNFFGQHPLAENAVRAAANDIDSLITSPLAAVTQSSFTGTSGLATVNLDMSATFQNPSTGATVTVSPVTLAANHVTIYVGMQKLTGSTLGVGGPGGAGYNLSYGGGTQAQQNAAYIKAQNAETTAFKRGAGPVIGTVTGNFDPNTPINLPYGALFGNLWFDDDTNNDGVIDSDAMLNAYWHFDSTTLPSSDQNDFFSVALHELLHTLGFGTSDTWRAQASGTTWTGANAKALNGGSGVNLVDPTGHINSGVSSTRLSDGTVQDPVMTPTITTGTRKDLTAMDAAFLRDLGYTTIPEPGSFGLLVAGIGMLAGSRRMARRDRSAPV